MSYIGNQAGFGKYVKLDSMQSFFNGSLKTFATLVNASNYQCGSAMQLLVIKNGLILDPLVDYTVSNASITYTVAPIISDVINIRGFGQVFNFPNVSDASVTSAKIQDGAVTTNKIASNAITSSKMADNSITTSRIVDANVTSGKIADDAVTVSKITTNAVTNAKIADGAITTAKITDGNITTSKIADANITTAKIADGAITTAKMDAAAITDLRIIKQNIQIAAYTFVLADSGMHILHPSSDTTARTFTIPANSSVAFPIGSTITIINQNNAGVITIAITTDTLRLAGTGGVGSRTIAANGMATIMKTTATEWVISGIGLA